MGINTGRPNRLVADALARDRIPELSGYSSMRREVRYGRNCRIDLLLERPGRPTCLVEVKNVTMRRSLETSGPIEFPDSVTARGVKQIAELADEARRGNRAVMLYIAQRSDAGRLAFAVAAIAIALDSGVGSGQNRSTVDVEGVRLAEMMSVDAPARAPA